MRTDAKIGFAIGGVLLAVLTVYAIVVPRHVKKTTGTVSLVTPPPSSSDNSTGTPPIAAADGAASAPVPLTPAKPAQPDRQTLAMDNTGGAAQPDGFHPLAAAKPPVKTDDQKTAKLIDGVYTPDKKSAGKRADTIDVLPDQGDVAGSTDSLYTIKSGQTLSKIAYEVYGNSRFWVVIQRENKGLDANHLKVGSKIKLPDISAVVPGPVTVSDEEVAPLAMAQPSAPEAPRQIAESTTDARSYTVKAGDSLYGIAKRLLGSGRRADALYNLNKDVIGPDKSKLKLDMVLKLPDPARAAAN